MRVNDLEAVRHLRRCDTARLGRLAMPILEAAFNDLCGPHGYWLLERIGVVWTEREWSEEPEGAPW